MPTLPGNIQQAASGLRGFDIDQILTAAQAQDFKNAGYDFCIRYVPRTAALAASTNTNLTNTEALAILNAGLALMVVQHTRNEGWSPTAALGTADGQYAVTYASQVAELPQSINIWCDLEVVAANTNAADVIGYCQAWYNAVNAGGYVPGLYVGYGIVLTAQQLYSTLSFKHYWSAYNAEVGIAHRGYQITQHNELQLSTVTPDTQGNAFDPNTIQTDQLGGTPVWLSL
ncbi:MAG: hypothetical protein JWP94_554 [Mucilaginibacter sp.]|nr:hypothetical protein [Mucilaginibacter sp.]